VLLRWRRSGGRVGKDHSFHAFNCIPGPERECTAPRHPRNRDYIAQPKKAVDVDPISRINIVNRAVSPRIRACSPRESTGFRWLPKGAAITEAQYLAHAPPNAQIKAATEARLLNRIRTPSIADTITAPRTAALASAYV